jgi:carbon-monoxide dehydrogenase small subunit
MKVSVVVNGAGHDVDCHPSTLLVHLLREELQLTGTHVGCDTSSCGACTVILDGAAVKSCTVLAGQADGREIETVEGLGPNGRLGPLQRAFAEHFALQCGFCTSGFLMAATALLRENPQPSELEVRKALEGNLCRCTGYQHIVDAVLSDPTRNGHP